jgi:RHS repeat-associated protein
VQRFVWGTKSNVPDYMIAAGVTYKFITDERGSVRFVVNAATGATVEQIEYDEFGKVLTDTNPGFQPFGFAGGLYDASTSLVHFGAREYDASVGRWLSKDPLLFGGGDTNLFGYVHNDPINFRDPLGTYESEFGAALDAALERDGITRWTIDASGQFTGWNSAGDIVVGGTGTTSTSALLMSVGELSATTVGAAIVGAFTAGYLVGQGINSLLDTYYWHISTPLPPPQPQSRPKSCGVGGVRG